MSSFSRNNAPLPRESGGGENTNIQRRTHEKRSIFDVFVRIFTAMWDNSGLKRERLVIIELHLVSSVIANYFGILKN